MNEPINCLIAALLDLIKNTFNNIFSLLSIKFENNFGKAK